MSQPQITYLESLEEKRSKWIGPVLPLLVKHGGRLASVGIRELISSSILMILGTPTNTDIMEPEFGSVLKDILFEPNDAVLGTLIEQYIAEAISRWEPRLRLYKTEVQVNQNEVRVTLHFIILEFGTPTSVGFSLLRGGQPRIIQSMMG